MRRQWWNLAVLAGTATLAFGNALQAQKELAPDKPAATINGKPIFVADVDAVLKMQPPMNPPPSAAQQRLMKHEALEMLMDDAILRQFLKKHAPAVAPDEDAKKFAELLAGLKAQNKTLADFLKETGQTEQQLHGDLHKMLQWAAYVKNSMSEDDLKRYFADYRDYFDRITVRVSHILIRVPPSVGSAEREQARAKLQTVRQQIMAGTLDFGEAAKKYSQCVSAPSSGDIGFIPRKWAVDETLARTAFALKVGEISEVVQTDFGFHLVKVTERKPGQPANFEAVKEEVRESFVEELRLGVLNKERKEARIEVFLP
jgi:peptidyl-prolyl cis-trans isomerase C